MHKTNCQSFENDMLQNEIDIYTKRLAENRTDLFAQNSLRRMKQRIDTEKRRLRGKYGDNVTKDKTSCGKNSRGLIKCISKACRALWSFASTFNSNGIKTLERNRHKKKGEGRAQWKTF